MNKFDYIQTNFQYKKRHRGERKGIDRKNTGNQYNQQCIIFQEKRKKDQQRAIAKWAKRPRDVQEALGISSTTEILAGNGSG